MLGMRWTRGQTPGSFRLCLIKDDCLQSLKRREAFCKKWCWGLRYYSDELWATWPLGWRHSDSSCVLRARLSCNIAFQDMIEDRSILVQILKFQNVFEDELLSWHHCSDVEEIKWTLFGCPGCASCLQSSHLQPFQRQSGVCWLLCRRYRRRAMLCNAERLTTWFEPTKSNRLIIDIECCFLADRKALARVVSITICINATWMLNSDLSWPIWEPWHSSMCSLRPFFWDWAWTIPMAPFHGLLRILCLADFICSSMVIMS